MSVLDIFAKPAQIQEMKKHNALLEKQTGLLQQQITGYKQVQETLVKDILTLQEVQEKNVGNEYRDYGTAVGAIREKYNATASWGVVQTGAIIDLRAAFILGEGIQITHTTESKEEAAKELQWAKDFMDYNDLDAEMAQEMAKEAEIEGKIAIKLFYDEMPWKKWPGMISARYLSWSSKKYEVEADPQDYMWYKNLKWQAGTKYPAGNLGEQEFIYKKFGGSLNDPNEAQPKIMKCLTQIDRLDKALSDLRIRNHIHSKVTPAFKCENMNDVTAMLKSMKDTNWKIGMAIAYVGEFSLMVPAMTDVEALIQEIELYLKIISGTTGVPIHYLGLLDLLKNRATGENTRELIMTATSKERQTWIGAYAELLTKAMEMFNQVAYAQKSKEVRLDPTRIAVDIPHVDEEHWSHIETLITAAAADIVSKEYVASQVPGIDMDAEAERREEREAEQERQAKEEMAYLKAQAAMGGGNA